MNSEALRTTANSYNTVKSLDESRIKIRGANGRAIALMMMARGISRGSTVDYVVLLQDGKFMTHESTLEAVLLPQFSDDWKVKENPAMCLARRDMWRIVGKELMRNLFWRKGRAVKIARAKV